MFLATGAELHTVTPTWGGGARGGVSRGSATGPSRAVRDRMAGSLERAEGRGGRRGDARRRACR
eukprot:5560202-Pyramimonas_sp.AAC.1